MSQSNASTPPEGDDVSFEADDDLQFDQAEYETPAHPAGPMCSLCHQPIADAYYEIGGKVFCATCRGRIEESFRGGSRLGRVLKAFVYGSAAALAEGHCTMRSSGRRESTSARSPSSWVSWSAEPSRAGTGNRGGLFYQFLAVFLAYSSIVAMYLPLLVEDGLEQGPEKDEQAKVAPAKVDPDRAKAKDKALAGEKDKDAFNANGGLGCGREVRNQASQRFLLLAVVLIGFLYSLPAPDRDTQAPISGLIFGFRRLAGLDHDQEGPSCRSTGHFAWQRARPT